MNSQNSFWNQPKSYRIEIFAKWCEWCDWERCVDAIVAAPYSFYSPTDDGDGDGDGDENWKENNLKIFFFSLFKIYQLNYLHCSIVRDEWNERTLYDILFFVSFFFFDFDQLFLLPFTIFFLLRISIWFTKLIRLESNSITSWSHHCIERKDLINCMDSHSIYQVSLSLLLLDFFFKLILSFKHECI